jgi:hypothetical protein
MESLLIRNGLKNIRLKSVIFRENIHQLFN